MLCANSRISSAGSIQNAFQWISSGYCIGVSCIIAGANRNFGDVTGGANDIGGDQGRGTRNLVFHILLSTNRLLDVAEVEDATGTVGTLLPGTCADEEDGDEGEQDKDDDCQFEQGHTGLGLHVLGVGQFHSVLFSIFYLGVFFVAWRALWDSKVSEFFGVGAGSRKGGREVEEVISDQRRGGEVGEVGEVISEQRSGGRVFHRIGLF